MLFSLEIRDENINRFEMHPCFSDLSIHAKYLTLSLILVIISLIGDQLLQIKRSLVNSYLIAICDNLIHAFIANISWILIIVSKGAPILESMVLLQSLISAIIASAIDLDHVIAAHSFDLKVSKRFPKTLNTFHVLKSFETKLIKSDSILINTLDNIPIAKPAIPSQQFTYFIDINNYYNNWFIEP